jgi:DNA-binding CsgD family transcriptional regulator
MRAARRTFRQAADRQSSARAARDCRGVVDYRLSREQVRKLCSLVESCGELRKDADAWQEHLVASLAREVGGFCSTIVVGTSGTSAWTPLASHVGLAEAAPVRAGFARFASSGCRMSFVGREAVRERLTTDHFAAVTLREAAAGDRAYQRSDFFQNHLRPIGAHDTLAAWAVTPECNVNLTLSRERHDRPFASADIGFMAAVTEHVAARIGTQLLLHHQKGRHGLTPRQREVLDCLLQGLSEKEAAGVLAIAQPTVHEHVSALHRYFGARSRGELLARARG